MNGVGGLNGHDSSGAAPDANDQVLQALEIIHNPKSTNSFRQTASQYLEEIKSDKDAPYRGFILASTRSQPPFVRHYGLGLLGHVIRHSWADYTVDQRTALRDWVLELAQSVTDNDPLYIRNKLAELWVETAKRSWVLEWMNMDELLVRLWDGSATQKMLVLSILETLSEDIFGQEDTAAALRGTELNRACVDIFTPARVLIEHFPSRETSVNVRYGEEGWLSRVGSLLDWCIGDAKINEIQQVCAVKGLSTLRSAVGWVIPKALVATNSLHRICRCLAASDISVQLAAVDILHTLYSRSRISDDDFRDLVWPLFSPDIIELLRRLYEWSIVDATNIDEEKYLLSKKFAEMIYNIGNLIDGRPSFLPQENGLGDFFDLLLSIVKNQSLHVSIPVLHLWAWLLGSEKIRRLPAVTRRVGELLEICSHRLIRYEALPLHTTNPSIIFLNEDVDTLPERHAFLGNYTRFCNQIVELIVEEQPVDALYHILAQADHMLDHLYDGEPPFEPRDYSKTSAPLLRLDAQFSVVEAALKGCAKWLSSRRSPTHERELDIMTSNMQVWCDRLISMTFEDPLIRERIVQLAVGFATGPLKRNASFALRVFEYTLETRCPDDPTYETYSDAVKDLHAFCLHQLQRLAMRFPDYLITIFDELEKRVDGFRQNAADDQTRTRYSSVLFIILHRATCVEEAPRQRRLESFLHPLISSWQRPDLGPSLSTFDGFCQLLGLGNIQPYITARAFHKVKEWSSCPLDDEGRLLQLQMQNAIESLPLRSTKTILSVSVERLEPGSRPYHIAHMLWKEKVPLLLPNLLFFIRQAHAFHDPANWGHLPLELRSIVSRILTDRFWQVGISAGSRDEFYAKVGGTKTTVEGLASSIRATLRAVRETGYRILYYLSLLGEDFYGYPELPEPLSQALFTDACALSSHQMTILVEMIRPIINNCPAPLRSHFLRPVLSGLFQQLDQKVSTEWNKIEQSAETVSENDNLAEEMRDDSILRQLTFTSVMLMVGLLDPQKPGPEVTSDAIAPDPPQPAYDSTRVFILHTPEVLKPIILFCTHALRMRDTRSCSFITRVLRSLVPEFDSTTTVAIDVREFISTEVLKACITSLHDSYFVDMQKDLAQLIASIVTTYSGKTDTPRNVLLSLPSMVDIRVDRTIRQLVKAAQNSRQQRALILDLLAGLRGVSISEQGKVPKPDTKKVRSAMQEKYMTVDVQADQGRGESPDLEGFARLFVQSDTISYTPLTTG